MEKNLKNIYFTSKNHFMSSPALLKVSRDSFVFSQAAEKGRDRKVGEEGEKNDYSQIRILAGLLKATQCSGWVCCCCCCFYFFFCSLLDH